MSGPDIRLMVDAATAWAKAEEGLPLMPIFREYDFFWVEAPLPIDDLDGHARFQGFGVPIGGGDLGLTTRFEYEEAFDPRQDRHRAARRHHGRRHHRADAHLRARKEARQARRHARLQVEHHDRRQPRLPVAALDGRAVRIFDQPVAAALESDATKPSRSAPTAASRFPMRRGSASASITSTVEKYRIG